MKKTILIFIISCLSVAVEAQKLTYSLPKGTENCGGFVIGEVKNDTINLKINKSLIYGHVSSCMSKEKAVFAGILIKNGNSERVDTIHSDINGYFKKIITPGTYTIRAAQVNYGSIETTFIDFNPQTSTQVDLYLSFAPSLKD